MTDHLPFTVDIRDIGERIVGLRKTAAWAFMGQDGAPAPLNLGGRKTTRWLTSEVLAFVASRPRKAIAEPQQLKSRRYRSGQLVGAPE